MVLIPKGRTHEYNVYDCTYNPTLSTSLYIAIEKQRRMTFLILPYLQRARNLIETANPGNLFPGCGRYVPSISKKSSRSLYAVY